MLPEWKVAVSLSCNDLQVAPSPVAWVLLAHLAALTSLVGLPCRSSPHRYDEAENPITVHTVPSPRQSVHGEAPLAQHWRSGHMMATRSSPPRHAASHARQAAAARGPQPTRSASAPRYIAGRPCPVPGPVAFACPTTAVSVPSEDPTDHQPVLIAYVNGCRRPNHCRGVD